jgi:spore coat polysaccharide biosynthesis predicted glycosyltransferase SpsG
MLEADLAVTAAGMTLYECLASGTPVVATCLADNQRPNFEALSRAGLIMRGEPLLSKAVLRLAEDAALREALSARGREVVDGKGAPRVAAEILRAALSVESPRIR